MESKRLKFIFSTCPLIIGILLFILITTKIGFFQIIKTISAISFKQFVILLAVNFSAILISILRWKIIMQSLEIPISSSRIAMAKFIGLTINYLTPGVFMGGEPFKAFFLKREAGIPLSKSVISIIIDEAVFLTVSFFLIIIGLFFLFHWALLSKKIAVIILLVFSLLLAAFYLFYTRTIYKKTGEKGFFSYIIDMLHLNKIKAIARFKHKIIEIENNLSVFFKAHRQILIIAVILTLIESFLYLTAFWLTIFYLGHKINFQTILTIMSTIYINYLIPIPAALGSLELSQSYMFNIFGIGEDVGIGFSFITRIISLFFIAVGLIVLTYFEIKILWQKLSQRIILFAEQISKMIWK